MKTFNDNAGRTWTLSVNIAAVKRVRSLLDVDLLELADGKLLERLVGDPVLLCDVIYCLLKPEADAAQVGDEDFGRAMAGDAIDCATEALLEELVAFFRQGKDLFLDSPPFGKRIGHQPQVHLRGHYTGSLSVADQFPEAGRDDNAPLGIDGMIGAAAKHIRSVTSTLIHFAPIKVDFHETVKKKDRYHCKFI